MYRRVRATVKGKENHARKLRSGRGVEKEFRFVSYKSGDANKGAVLESW